MKKFIALMLAMLMLLSFTACAADDTADNGGDATGDAVMDNTADTDNTTGTGSDSAEDSTAGGEQTGAVNDSDIDPEIGVLPEMGEPENGNDAAQSGDGAVSGDSPAQTLAAEFKTMVEADGSKTALEIAEALVTNPVIPFMGGAMEVEPGFLSGFDADEITGFEEGAVFMPMIGSIPFIGYIFQLEEGADVDAFIKTLEDSANLRWNICVEADEMVTGSVNNFVFFCMSPNSFE